jgi:hypothetical protein
MSKNDLKKDETRNLLKWEREQIMLRFHQAFGQFHQECPDYIAKEFNNLLIDSVVQVKL